MTATRNPGAERMRAAMQAYADAINAGDAQAIVALYADDATVEDPVGNEPLVGRAAIAAFYGAVASRGVKLRIVAPIRGSHGNAAAMAFEVDAAGPEGQRVVYRVIDVMTFNAAGLFTSMKAYWAPDDVSVGG